MVITNSFVSGSAELLGFLRVGMYFVVKITLKIVIVTICSDSTPSRVSGIHYQTTSPVPLSEGLKYINSLIMDSLVCTAYQRIYEQIKH